MSTRPLTVLVVLSLAGNVALTAYVVRQDRGLTERIREVEENTLSLDLAKVLLSALETTPAEQVEPPAGCVGDQVATWEAGHLSCGSISSTNLEAPLGCRGEFAFWDPVTGRLGC